MTRTLLAALRGGLIAVSLGVIATFAVGGLLLHFRMSPVLTGSMRPTYDPGDAVVTRQVDAHSLKPGDIALFAPPGEKAVYAHRITGIGTKDGHIVVTTRGDANPAPDPWRATLPDHVAKVVAVAPWMGRPLIWLRTPWLHAAAISVLGLLFTAIGTVTLLRTPKRREALT